MILDQLLQLKLKIDIQSRDIRSSSTCMHVRCSAQNYVGVETSGGSTKRMTFLCDSIHKERGNSETTRSN